jgi:hypothetical protein
VGTGAWFVPVTLADPLAVPPLPSLTATEQVNVEIAFTTHVAVLAVPDAHPDQL